MCTVTFIARQNGYALGMNRDEKLSRPAALPPARFRVGRREGIFPSESTGGTWIGINDARVALALINWYSVPGLPQPRGSRGHVVRYLLGAQSVEMAHEMIGTMPLSGINPFRLIGIFPTANAVVEWRWNTRVLERVHHPWCTNIWISSGHDETGAQQTRGKTFGRALQQPSAGSLSWLRRLHRSHVPECGPYSLCMHRSDAATVSYTEIIVAGQRAKMRYLAGPPCGCRPDLMRAVTAKSIAGPAKQQVAEAGEREPGDTPPEKGYKVTLTLKSKKIAEKRVTKRVTRRKKFTAIFPNNRTEHGPRSEMRL